MELKYLEIIKSIEENGGLDLKHMEFCARADHKVFGVDYISEWIKAVYKCHGNTANAVARCFYY